MFFLNLYLLFKHGVRAGAWAGELETELPLFQRLRLQPKKEAPAPQRRSGWWIFVFNLKPFASRLSNFYLCGSVTGLRVRIHKVPFFYGSLPGSLYFSTISVEGGQRYWCCPVSGCRKAFSKCYELRLHIMKHFDKKSFKCDYPGCSWGFVTSHKLERHKRTHNTSKDFTCCFEECGRKFTTLYNLRAHVLGHNRDEMFPCQSCSEKFPTQRGLDDHNARWVLTRIQCIGSGFFSGAGSGSNFFSSVWIRLGKNRIRIQEKTS